MNFEPDTDSESLFQAARETFGENGFDDSRAYLASKDGNTGKERLLMYLRALQSEPMIADQDAVRLVKRLARFTDKDVAEDFGIDVEFKASDKLLPEKIVPLEFLRDVSLRVELANLIQRLESSLGPY